MATKIDSAEKAFEAATITAVAKPAAAAAEAVTKVADAAKAAVKPVAKKAAAAKRTAAAKKGAATKAAKAPVAKKPVAKKPVAAKKVVTKTSAKTSKAATSPVAAATKGLKIMNDNVKKIAEETKARVETMTADINERAKDAMARSSKLAEEAVEFNKANIEALVEAGKIAAKGMEKLGQEAVDFSRKSFEDATVAMKGYTSVKSPAEFFKLYAENSKKAFDAAVAQTSKTSELVVKLANDSFAPISNRVADITSKVKAA